MGLASIDELRAEMADLRAQVQKLTHQAQSAEDYISISNLQRAYGYYIDRARWDDAADLFCSDCTLEINGRGVYVGQHRVRQYMHRFGPAQYGQLFNHMQLQPLIHVDSSGLTAKARLRALIQVGWLGKEGWWGEGTYENEYVKENQIWKIKKLHFYQIFYADYEKGWHRGPMALISELADFPPDMPPTETYQVYPEFFVPPYHYKNPVTGR